MDYSQLIQEDLFYLQEQERHAQQAIVRDRIRFLRLLKSGQCTTQKTKLPARSISASRSSKQRLLKKLCSAKGCLSPAAHIF